MERLRSQWLHNVCYYLLGIPRQSGASIFFNIVIVAILIVLSNRLVLLISWPFDLCQFGEYPYTTDVLIYGTCRDNCLNGNKADISWDMFCEMTNI